MLHSCANNPRQWIDLAGDLDGKFIPLCPDLLGYGTSVQADERSLKAIAENALQTAEIFEEPAHVIGHSFGGAVALKRASQDQTKPLIRM